MPIKNIELPYIQTFEEFQEEEQYREPIKRKEHISKKVLNTHPKYKIKDKKHLFFKIFKGIPRIDRSHHIVDKQEKFEERLIKFRKIINLDSIQPYLLELEYYSSDIDFIHYDSSKDFFYGHPVKAGYIGKLNLAKTFSRFTSGVSSVHQVSSPENKFKRRKEKAELAEIASEIYYYKDDVSCFEYGFGFDSADQNAHRIYNYEKKEKRKGFYSKKLAGQGIECSGVYQMNYYYDDSYYRLDNEDFLEYSSTESNKNSLGRDHLETLSLFQKGK